MSATLIVYPLDVIKTNLTVNQNNTKKLRIMPTFTNLVQKQGIAGLYKGLSVSLAGIAPFIALRMSVYDYCSTILSKHTNSKFEELVAHGSSGALASFIAVSVVYPSDLVRRLLHMNGTSKYHNYSNLLDVIKQTHRRGGILGFYQGFNATLAKSIPMSIMLFVFNDQLKKQITKFRE
jgi:solute carrier family 25 (mitochondrial phosphate transporter), member 23/24/25/41